MDGQTLTAWNYHRATEHHRFRMAGHRLDWAAQPDVIKRYPGAETADLAPIRSLGTASLGDLLDSAKEQESPSQPDLNSLSNLLSMGSGITSVRRHGAGIYTFRSAASAGALYPVDIYVDARRVDGLPSGLYHHRIDGSFLERLKTNTDGGGQPSGPFAVVYLGGVFFRSVWKYRDRAYRYILNDTGHVAANILLAARLLGFHAKLEYDFDDEHVNGFLGLDSSMEVCLAKISVYTWNDAVSETHVSPDVWGMTCTMPRPDYGNGAGCDIPAAVYHIHRSGVIAGQKPPVSRAWGRTKPGRVKDEAISWPMGTAVPGGLSFSEALARRRSRRNFHVKPLENEKFFNFLSLVVKGVAFMETVSRVQNAFHLELLVQNTEGLESGQYRIDKGGHGLVCVDNGGKNALMAGACLDQRWLAHASVHVLMTADVRQAEKYQGPRAYRSIMMNAGFLGQIIYLAATSFDLGCCGIGAFFDGEAAMILDGGDDEVLLYLVASGHVRGPV